MISKIKRLIFLLFCVDFFEYLCAVAGWDLAGRARYKLQTACGQQAGHRGAPDYKFGLKAFRGWRPVPPGGRRPAVGYLQGGS